MQSSFSYGIAYDVPPKTNTPAVDRSSDELKSGAHLNPGEQGSQGYQGQRCIENRCRVNGRLVGSVANTRNEIATASAVQDTIVAGQGSGQGVSMSERTAGVVSPSVPPGVAVAPTPHGLQANAAEAATDSDGEAELIHWLDRFLSIPPGRFIIPGDDVLEMFAHFDRHVAGKKLTAEQLRSVSLKRVLNSHVDAWLKKKQDRNETIGKLLNLQKLMSEDMTVYFRNWVLLKCYSDMVCGEPVSETDRQHLVQALNQSVFNDFAEITGKATMMLDFYSLSLLYFLGGLPYFENGVNYHKGLILLDYCPTILSEKYFFLSPISFSPYDYARFAPVSIKPLFDRQPNVPPENRLGVAMQMIVMSYLQQLNDLLSEAKGDQCWQWFSDSGLNYELFELVSKLIAESMLLAEVTNRRRKECKVRIQWIDKKINAIGNNIRSKYSVDGWGDIRAFVICLRAKIWQCLHTASPMCSFKLASLYRQAAQESPNHWSSAYIFFLKARKWALAANAAAEYARHYHETCPLLAQYWSDTSERVRELVALPEPPRGQAAASDKDYDFDAVLRQFSEDAPKEDVPKDVSNSPIQSVGGGRKKGKKRNGQRNSIPGSVNKSECDAAQSLRQGEAGPPEQQAIKPGHQAVLPVIRAVRSGGHGSLRLSTDCQGFQVQSARGAIKPFEKLLSRHWNPIVLQTLRCIRSARARSDITAERQIYQKLLNHPLLKTCIGIERIWEECAWTELHQFDDFFRSSVIPDAPMRQKARQWVQDARNKFILPSLMYCLGKDQITADIEPEAVWKAVLAMLEQPEIANDPQVDAEVRFRLRCLFSSMGHTYSLWAMTDLSNAEYHQKRAQTWYGYKQIDPGYVWTQDRDKVSYAPMDL